MKNHTSIKKHFDTLTLTRGWILSGCILIAAVCVCKRRQNPFDSIENVQVRASISSPADSAYFIGDTITISFDIFLADFIKEITVRCDSYSDTALANKKWDTEDTVTLRYPLERTGSHVFEIDAALDNNTMRDTTLEIFVSGIPPTVQTNRSGTIRLSAGSPCTLSVSASGTRPLSYQWYRNGREIDGAEGDTIIIDSTGGADTVQWHCTIVSEWGSAQSQPVKTVVVSPDVAAPENFTIVSRTPEHVTLSWSGVDGAEKYLLYRSHAAVQPKNHFTSVTDTFYTDADYSPGSYYWVSAEGGGHESDASEMVFAGSTTAAWLSDTIRISMIEGDTVRLDLADSAQLPDIQTPAAYSLAGFGARAALDGSELRIATDGGDSGAHELEALLCIDTACDTCVIIVTVDPVYFTITDNSENGTIRLLPAQESYRYGDTVRLAAAADSGFLFDRWLHGVSSSDSTAEIVVVSDTVVAAMFVAAEILACQQIGSGETISAAIRRIRSQPPYGGTLCLEPGEYNSGAVRLTGEAKIIIR
jgi:hypothetical protein